MLDKQRTLGARRGRLTLTKIIATFLLRVPQHLAAKAGLTHTQVCLALDLGLATLVVLVDLGATVDFHGRVLWAGPATPWPIDLD